MRRNKKARISANSNSKDDRNQQSCSTVWIKEEIEMMDDESEPFSEQLIKTEHFEEKTIEQQLSTDMVETDPLEAVQIKEEITFEETKVQEQSDFEKIKAKVKCKHCDFSCGCRTSLYKHIKQAHPSIGTFKCSICRSSFSGTSQLEKHVDEEHQGLGSECSICSALYKTDQKIDHRSQCPGRLLFDCGHCETRFVTKEGLWKHLEEHGVSEDLKESSVTETRHFEQFLSCAICEDGKAYRKDPYSEHIKEKHNGHYLRCPYCPKTFKFQGSYFNHKKCCSGSTQRRTNKNEQQCRHCSKSFQNRAAMETHIAWKHAEKQFQCEDCGIQFPSARGLRWHKVRVHTEPQFGCSYCSRKFHQQHELNQHVASHQSQILKLSCTICDFCCESQRTLSTHIKSVHPENMATRCNVCHTSFYGTSQLEKHIEEEHAGLGNVCSICLQMYRKDQKKEHRIECLGQLLFNCVSCEKLFVRKEGLWNHLDEHGIPEGLKEPSICETRIKKQFVSCDFCNDDCAYRKDLYQQHVDEEHHGEKLECPDCGKEFKNGGLFNHLKNHCKIRLAYRKSLIGEKHECPHCSKTFQNKAGLETHVSWKHGKKSNKCNVCGMECPTFDSLRYHKIRAHTEST